VDGGTAAVRATRRRVRRAGRPFGQFFRTLFGIRQLRSGFAPFFPPPARWGAFNSVNMKRALVVSKIHAAPSRPAGGAFFALPPVATSTQPGPTRPRLGHKRNSSSQQSTQKTHRRLPASALWCVWCVTTSPTGGIQRVIMTLAYRRSSRATISANGQGQLATAAADRGRDPAPGQPLQMAPELGDWPSPDPRPTATREVIAAQARKTRRSRRAVQVGPRAAILPVGAR